MTTYIAGVQTTENINSDERKVDITPKLYWLRPDNSPLVILTAGGKGASGLPIGKQEVPDAEYKMLEKEPHGCWTAINYSTGYTAGATTLVCDAVDFIKVGATAKIVGGEIVHVTAKSNADKTITVTRSVGPTAAASIADNTPIYVIGTAKEEFGALGSPLQVQNRSRTNYTQVFEYVFGLSGTLQATRLQQGKKWPEMRREAYLEIMKEVERAFLFGEPAENPTGGPNGLPIRWTGGAYYWISQGGGTVTTATTTFTKSMWLTFCRSAFEYGSDTKIGLAAPLVIEMLDYWKDGKLEMKPTDFTYNICVTQWETGQGTLLVARDRELRNSPAGTTTAGYGGTMIVLDRDNIDYRHMPGRDIALYEDVVRDGADGRKDKFLGEVGFGLTLPETHSILTAISTYA